MPNPRLQKILPSMIKLIFMGTQMEDIGPPPRTTVTLPRPASREETTPSVATGCVPCSSDHLSTVSAVLNEALRFARSEGLQSMEVVRRVAMAEDELNAMERIDAAPDKLETLSEKDRKLMREVLPKARDIRHLLKGMTSVENLEKAASLALKTRVWLRAAMMGIPMERLVSLAAKVQKGEMSETDAKENIKSIIGGSKKES